MAEIRIDTTGWTQDAKNMTTAMAVQLLYQAGITYASIKDLNGVITLTGESASATTVLTAATISAAYAAWKVLNDAATAAAKAEQDARDAELSTNPYRDITLAQVDTAIDNAVNAITNLADAKVFLKAFCKRVVRYIKARGL
jgi:hypothetical protein